jgi:hypothetical protein
MSIDTRARLELLEISGEPYEAGAALGRFGAHIVHQYLKSTLAWASVVAQRSDARLLAMVREVEAKFPRYFAELRGLADGLELPFDEVFAWNCRGDVWAMAPDGCTTVQIPGERRVVAHNEDGDPGLNEFCALARIDSSGGVPFTAFVYPGSIPGHTFAATDNGLVQTVNNIRARDAGEGLPRMVMTRAVLDCPTLDSATALIRSANRSGAFHLTLAQVGDPRLLSVEFTSGICSVREISAPALHANHLVHEEAASVSQIVTDSSGSRQKRGDALVAEGCDPLAILRDTAGPGLPIRRDDPEDPDNENTLASAVFVIEADRLNWSVYDRADEPARFHIRERWMKRAKHICS